MAEPIINPELSQIASVGTGVSQAPTVQSPATLGVLDSAGRPIPDASISSAISAGEANFVPERVYDLLDPDGLPKRVKGQHVLNAMSRGWALESPEGRELRLARENATLGGKLLAGAQGVGEGLTLGTLPALVEGFGGKDAIQSYRKSRAASEEAATIGEVLSLATPIGVESLAARGLGAASKFGRGAMTAAELATIAPRTVSKVARKAGEKVAGALPTSSTVLGQAFRRGTQLGVEGALEGSVYGVGFAIGEASLGDSELTAERLLAGAGAGALLGAGIGGSLGSVGSLAASGASRTAAALPGFAEKMAFRSTGATGAQIRQAGLDQARRSGRRMLDEGLTKFESLEERAIALREATESAGKDIRALIEKIDDTGARPQLAPIIRKIDEQLGELRNGIGDKPRLARKIDRDFGNWFRERIATDKSPTFKELHRIRAEIDEHVRGAAPGSIQKTEFGKLRTAIEEEIQSQADKLARQAGDEFSGAYTAAKARYKDLVTATNIAEKRAPELGSSSFTFFDRAAAVAGLMTGNPAGLLAAGVSKLAREHGDTAAAKLADRFSKKGAKPPTLAEVLSGAPRAANDAFPTQGLGLIQKLGDDTLQSLPTASLDELSGPVAPTLKPLSLDEIVARARRPANDNARRAARKTSIDDAQKHFDEMATRAEEAAKSGDHSTVLDRFLNSERAAVSKAEREAIKNEISDRVTEFLKQARNAGADYKGQVFRGMNKKELTKLLDDDSVNASTWSASKDPEGAKHFAKRGGVLVVIPENSGGIPVDGLTGSNTFNEVLIPKGMKWKVAGEEAKDGVTVVTLESVQPKLPRASDTPDHLLFGPGMSGAPANDVAGLAAANDNFLQSATNDNRIARILAANDGIVPANNQALANFITANDNALQEAAEKAAKKEIREKLEALGYVKEKADKTALAISKATKDAVSDSAHKVIPKVPSGAAAYEALAADAREHRVAPDRSAVKIAARVAPLVTSAPELANAVTAKVTGDLQYLSAQLPSAGLAGLSPAQAQKVVPSASERASFVRQARAIQDPKTLVFDMKKGTLSEDALKAIRERRPLLLSKIQEEAEAAYAQLVKEGKAPSRQMRLQLERLLGRSLDPASNPVVVKIVQQTYQEQAEAMATPVPPTPQSSSKRANRLMSYSETIAYGEGI